METSPLIPHEIPSGYETSCNIAPFVNATLSTLNGTHTHHDLIHLTSLIATTTRSKCILYNSTTDTYHTTTPNPPTSSNSPNSPNSHHKSSYHLNYTSPHKIILTQTPTAKLTSLFKTSPTRINITQRQPPHPQQPQNDLTITSEMLTNEIAQSFPRQQPVTISPALGFYFNKSHQRPQLRSSAIYDRVLNDSSIDPLTIASLNCNTLNKRLDPLQTDLLRMYDTDENVDALMLQETHQMNPIQLTSTFSLKFDKFEVCATEKNGITPHSNGQAIFIRKDLQPKLNSEFSTPDGSSLAVEFVSNHVKYIAISIYINPDSALRRITLPALIQQLNQAIALFPLHQIVIAGDFNIKYNAMKKSFVDHLSPHNFQIKHLNHPEQHTFRRVCNAGSEKDTSVNKNVIDHAFAINTMPNNQYRLTIKPVQQIFQQVTSDHLCLKIDIVAPSSLMTVRPPAPQETVDSPSMPSPMERHFPKEHEIFEKHRKLLKKLNDPLTIQRITDVAGLMHDHPLWEVCCDEMSKLLSGQPNQHTIDELNRLFTDCTLNSLQATINTPNSKNNQKYNDKAKGKTTSKAKKIWIETSKFTDYLTMWEQRIEGIRNGKLNHRNLSREEALHICCANFSAYNQDMTERWAEIELKELRKQLKKMAKTTQKGHNWQRERLMEDIIDYYAPTGKTKRSAEIKAIKDGDELVFEDGAIAQAFQKDFKAFQEQRLQEAKAKLAEAPINGKNDSKDSDIDAQMDSIIDLSTLVTDPSRVTPADRAELDKPFTIEELIAALMKMNAHSAPGIDKTSAACLRTALPVSNPSFDPNLTCESHIKSNFTNTTYRINDDYVVKTPLNKDKKRYSSNSMDPNPMLLCLLQLLNACYDSAVIPTIWQHNIIIRLYKQQGEHTEINNYRPIALTSNTLKILNAMINHRLLKIKDKLIHQNQIGYQDNRGRAEGVCAIMNKIVHESWNMLDTYTILVDLRKAFDTIPHDMLIRVLERKLNEEGENGKQNLKAIQYIKTFQSSIQVATKINSSLSTFDQQTVGVKQGCALSPLLFIIFYDLITRTLHHHFSPTALVITYADDLTLSSTDKTVLQKAMTKLTSILHDLNLSLNVGKTKVLKTYGKDQWKNKNQLQDDFKFPDREGKTVELDIVSESKYLGMMLRSIPTFENFVDDLKVDQLIAQYSPILNHPNVPIHLKIAVIKSYIYPKLLHNAEVLGMLLLTDIRNKIYFIDKVDKKIGEVLRRMSKQPTTIKPAQLACYMEYGITMPHIYITTMFVKTLVGWIESSRTLEYIREEIELAMQPQRTPNNQTPSTSTTQTNDPPARIESPITIATRLLADMLAQASISLSNKVPHTNIIPLLPKYSKHLLSNVPDTNKQPKVIRDLGHYYACHEITPHYRVKEGEEEWVKQFEMSYALATVKYIVEEEAGATNVEYVKAKRVHSNKMMKKAGEFYPKLRLGMGTLGAARTGAFRGKIYVSPNNALHPSTTTIQSPMPIINTSPSQSREQPAEQKNTSNPEKKPNEIQLSCQCGEKADAQHLIHCKTLLPIMHSALAWATEEYRKTGSLKQCLQNRAALTKADQAIKELETTLYAQVNRFRYEGDGSKYSPDPHYVNMVNSMLFQPLSPLSYAISDFYAPQFNTSTYCNMLEWKRTEPAKSYLLKCSRQVCADFAFIVTDQYAKLMNLHRLKMQNLPFQNFIALQEIKPDIIKEETLDCLLNPPAYNTNPLITFFYNIWAAKFFDLAHQQTGSFGLKYR